MQIYIRTLAGVGFHVEMQLTDTILQLKYKVFDILGILASNQRLIHLAFEMQNIDTIAQHYTPDDDIDTLLCIRTPAAEAGAEADAAGPRP